MRPSLAALLVLASPLAAQGRPPDSLVNVRVIPRETPVREVISQMGGITRALGVRCTFCHVGDEGMNIWDYDFASDEKPAKRKAREMMRMVQAINGEYLTRLADLDAQGLEVDCATCHRGVRLPQPLSQVLLGAHVDGGVAGMDSTYEALRARYFGRAAYDFGEVTLDDVASRLFDMGARDDAIRTYRRNAELFGTSAFAQRRLGEAQLAVGDTAAAVTAFRAALAINPRDRTTRQALERLGVTPSPEG
jgi:tetratricopeptide (TPR) repeat protein